MLKLKRLGLAVSGALTAGALFAQKAFAQYTAADSLQIVNSANEALGTNLRNILPIVFVVVIAVAVLFFGWRKLHGLARGRG